MAGGDKDDDILLDLDDEGEIEVIEEEIVDEVDETEDRGSEESGDKLEDIETTVAARVAEAIDVERAAALGRELELKKSNAAMRRQSAEMLRETIKDRSRQATAARIAAEEDGDIKARLEADEALSKLRQAENEVTQVIATARREEVAQPPAQEGPKPRNPHADRFLAQNAWARDAQYRPQQAFLLETANQLMAEGKNPNDPTFYQVAAERLHEAFPKLGVKTMDGKAFASGKLARGEARGPALGPSSGTPKNANPKQITVSREERRVLSSLGVDLTNPEHRKEYLKTRLERAS